MPSLKLRNSAARIIGINMGGGRVISVAPTPDDGPPVRVELEDGAVGVFRANYALANRDGELSVEGLPELEAPKPAPVPEPPKHTHKGKPSKDD